MKRTLGLGGVGLAFGAMALVGCGGQEAEHGGTGDAQAMAIEGPAAPTPAVMAWTPPQDKRFSADLPALRSTEFRGRGPGNHAEHWELRFLSGVEGGPAGAAVQATVTDYTLRAQRYAFHWGTGTVLTSSKHPSQGQWSPWTSLEVPEGGGKPADYRSALGSLLRVVVSLAEGREGIYAQAPQPELAPYADYFEQVMDTLPWQAPARVYGGASLPSLPRSGFVGRSAGNHASHFTVRLRDSLVGLSLGAGIRVDTVTSDMRGTCVYIELETARIAQAHRVPWQPGRSCTDWRLVEKASGAAGSGDYETAVRAALGPMESMVRGRTGVYAEAPVESLSPFARFVGSLVGGARP